jgi:NAD(P)-dependent dehydrogenase (short-subunit alcohol dehydrogenase family)
LQPCSAFSFRSAAYNHAKWYVNYPASHSRELLNSRRLGKSHPNWQDPLTPEQFENNIQNRIPLHCEGRPEDVARLILPLVENDFITGEDFVIAGGMTMPIV